jgi:hypothetical protein
LNVIEIDFFLSFLCFVIFYTYKKRRTRYCQLISLNNRIKRFIYACCAKIYKENYHDSIHVDEFTVELRQRTIKTWFKSNKPLGAAGGKVGKLNIH